MVKVFIAGANGYIGYPVAQALTRAGHDVYGLTRNMDVAMKLQENEIKPVIGDATSPRGWIEKVKDVDVVIDAVGGDNNSTACGVLYHAFTQEAKSQRMRANGPPLIYIYTSGTMVYGDDSKTPLNDFSPFMSGLPLTGWRIPHEKQVANTKTPFIQGVVIRPSLVYGRKGSVLDQHLFRSASTGIVQWFGRRGGRTATIHQDDLADLYVKVLEKAPILGGLSFVAANPESESWDFVLSELCKIVGASDVAYFPPSTPFETALAMSQRFNVSSARDLLGWAARKRSLGDGMAQYYAAWQASEGGVTVLGVQ